jgi:hypothetical protein
MPHPDLQNRTPFAFDALFVADEEGRPVVAPIVKATFDIAADGSLKLADEQLPVDFTGRHHGEPAESSYRFEPDVAFTKLSTDVVLHGHANAPSARSTSVDVELRVGPVERRIRVSGDRVWVKRLLGIAPSAPERFEKVPLIYERAYGGWDRSPEDPAHHAPHAANPVGVGYRGKHARFVERSPLPNLEDLKHPLTSYRGKAVAAGFGFVCPHWEQRRALAGTYDDAWARERMPLLPRDFDRRFFSAASPGLIAPTYLRGDESVQVQGASPEGRLAFRLPGVRPACRIALRRSEETRLAHLDTAIVDADARRLILVWRCFTTLRDGPLDVRAIEVSAENAPARPAPPDNVVPLRGRDAA